MTQQNTSLQDTRPKNYIGSALLFLGIFSTATVVGLLLIVGMLTTFKIRWKIGYAWCAIIGWMTKVFCGLTYEVEGMEHINPQQPVDYIEQSSVCMGNTGIKIYSAAAFSGHKT